MVVTDVSLYQQFNSKIEEVEEFVVSTMSHVDMIYQGIGMRVAFVGMENWQASDQVDVSTKAGSLLRTFSVYRQNNLLKKFKQHDVSIFMT